MPQMKPMIWTSLMMITLMMILMTIIMNFFMNMNTKMKMSEKTINTLKWKW